MNKKLFILILFIFSFKIVYGAAPTLETIPSPQNLTEDVPYTYIVNATDPEGGAITFTDNTANFDIVQINDTHANISFTPTSGMVGSFLAVIIAMDEEFLVDAQAINFTINGVPSFDNLADKYVTAGEQFYYDIDATDDEDGSNLNFSDDSALFEINSTTGVINFTTSLGQVGEYSITITINDTVGAEYSDSFNLAINDWPNASNIPDSNATEDLAFSINMSQYVNNTVGDLTFYDNSSYFDIDPSTGIISFTPNGSMTGENYINITVVDEYGLNASRADWFLNISAVNDAPFFAAIPNQTAYVGRAFTYDINATDEEGNNITYSDDSDYFEINQSGFINFSVDGAMVGINIINITVEDNYTTNYSDTFVLEVLNNHPPGFPANITINITPNFDSYVDALYPNTNYLGNEYLRISDLDSATKRSYFNFSLGQIPNGAYISLASLNLTISNALEGANISAYLINETWNASALTYNNQPLFDSAPLLNSTSVVEGGMEGLPLTGTVIEWFNGTLDNYGILLRMQNESSNLGTIGYYSGDYSNDSKRAKLFVTYNSTLEDQSLEKDANLTDVFDLDDYFYDLDNDTLTYSYTEPEFVNLTIDANNVVSIFSGTRAGVDEVVFSANDGLSETNSNSINITVVAGAAGTSSSGSSGGSSSSRTASLAINLDSARETINKGDILQLPISIENIGELTINSIEISSSVDNPGLVIRLTNELIETLGVDEKSELEMVIDSTAAIQDTYVVTLVASSLTPAVNASAVFVLDVLSETKEIEEQLLTAQDMFQQNPECLELQELIDKAEELLLSGSYNEARSNIALAIEGCKNMIRTSSPPLKSEARFSLLGMVLIGLTVITIITIISYTIISRVRYIKKK